MNFRRQKENSSDIVLNKLQKQMEKRIHGVDPEDQFLDYIILLIDREKNAADRNKRLYFCSETAVLFCSCMTAFLGGVSAGGGISEQGVATAGIVVAVVSSVSAFLIGMRGLWKWQETWLRHRGFVNRCNEEFRKFANYVGEYEAYLWKESESEEENRKQAAEHEKEKAAKFKTMVLGLMEQNNNQFLRNMGQKKTDTSE